MKETETHGAKNKRGKEFMTERGGSKKKREKCNRKSGEIWEGPSYRCILFVAQMHKLRRIIVKVTSKALSDVVKWSKTIDIDVVQYREGERRFNFL